MNWRANDMCVGIGCVLLLFGTVANAAADEYPSVSNANAGARAPLLVSPRSVNVQRDGDQFHVDATIHADVPQKIVWEVLTDFSHLVQILSDVHVSDVIPGADDRHLSIRQVGMARFGPFTKKYESTREVVLVPQEQISATNVAGNVKSMHSVMTLSPEPGGTRLVYHADVEPGFWLPPLVGPAAVRDQTAEQFSALIVEMKKREAAARAATSNAIQPNAASGKKQTRTASDQ
ncbi:hypothetical protein G7047_11425 [Diaphorobacter sp. HDW4A]|uniref:SRPBCC family protein n=1 Tax=Diaphorobacter sp. HDW4A TaxID=2714924 RepID=UPI001407DA2D|nr:SRPBCC family protein [Diaphorobacter sp. HDW4A]QIL80444.1 hypothetical protein G7047_11425 [Diaphorobacter sp. HDW4A]